MLKLNVVKNEMVQQWPQCLAGDSWRRKASKRTSARDELVWGTHSSVAGINPVKCLSTA